MSDRIGISRVDFADGHGSIGTKVFLSDGSELEGVVSVSQSAAIDKAQTITVTVFRMVPKPVVG